MVLALPQEAKVPASSNHLPERPLTAVLAVRPWVPFSDSQSITYRMQGEAAISQGSCEVFVSFLDGLNMNLVTIDEDLPLSGSW